MDMEADQLNMNDDEVFISENVVNPEIIALPSNMVALFYILKNAKVEQPLEKLQDFAGKQIKTFY